MRGWPGAVAAAAVAVLLFGPLLAVMARGGSMPGLTSADWAAVRFTVSQALVSAVFSLGLAVPVARALARQRFKGRGLLVTLLGAPFILPVIVAVFGLLAVFGRGGVVNNLLAAVGLPTLSIYGFWGVVLGHVFFNMPLATRFLLQGWLAIPAERFRLAESLRLPVFRVLEWPMLRSVGPGVFMVVFALCLTSFAVALTLGGGPGATTVELAIYQAMRFDFDLGKAAVLSLVQVGLTGMAAAAAGVLTVPEGFGAGLDRTVPRWGRSSRGLDVIVIALAALFLILPLGAVVVRGLSGLTGLPASVGWAALRSLMVALLAAGLTVALALPMALRSRGRWIGLLPLALSPLVLGTGVFLIAQPLVNPTRLALPVTVVLNALLCLPFAIRVLGPAVDGIEAGYGRLATSVGLTGWGRLRVLLLPRLRRQIGFVAGLAAALSMGDLGVITLFAGQDHATLPLVMYRLMGSYRTEAASGAALLLLALSLALFWVFDRGGRVDVDA